MAKEVNPASAGAEFIESRIDTVMKDKDASHALSAETLKDMQKLSQELKHAKDPESVLMKYAHDQKTVKELKDVLDEATVVHASEAIKALKNPQALKGNPEAIENLYQDLAMKGTLHSLSMAHINQRLHQRHDLNDLPGQSINLYGSAQLMGHNVAFKFADTPIYVNTDGSVLYPPNYPGKHASFSKLLQKGLKAYTNPDI